MQRLRRGSGERKDANQAIAVDVGQRPQQNRVEQAECHRGKAKAQPERRANEEREQRTPSQLAKGSAQVPQQGVEPVQAVGLAPRLLDCRNAAEVDMRHPPRFPFAHAPRKVLLDRHLQVGVELVVELPLGRGPAQAGPRARQPSPENHRVASRNNATIAAVRSQRSTCFSSWRRPVSVSE